MSVLHRKNRKETMRKNVTLDPVFAQGLERMSEVSGKAQGELLELALMQPAIHRFRVFSDPVGGNAVAELLDACQADYGAVPKDIWERALEAVSRFYLPNCKYFQEGSRESAAQVNDYIGTHVPVPCMEASPFLAGMHAAAKEGRFVTGEEAHDREAAKGLVGAMLESEDNRVVGETYLFRDLYLLFALLFHGPDEGCFREMYRYFVSDGAMFGFC